MSNPGEDVVGRIFQQTKEAFRGPEAGMGGNEGPCGWTEVGRTSSR